MFINNDFITAVSDYQYLLERGYSNKNILKIVSDRYQLNTIQRSFLYRGIATLESANKRKSKLVTEKNIANKPFIIDTYNLLITLHSYLKGKPVFVANDGFLRDAGELKAKISKSTLLQRPIDLTFSYLKTLPLSSITFYLDQPVLNSKEISKTLNLSLVNNELNGKVIRSKQVDRALVKLKNGILYTSDTEIIDSTQLMLFDLARNILSYHFNTHFVNLQNLINTA